MELPLDDDKFLLMDSVSLVQIGTLLLFHIVKSILVDHPRPVMLFLVLLKLGKGNEQLLVHVLLPKELKGALIDGPGAVDEPMALLKSGEPDPVAWLGVTIDKLLIDESCPVQLLVAQLKLDVGKRVRAARQVPTPSTARTRPSHPGCCSTSPPCRCTCTKTVRHGAG